MHVVKYLCHTSDFFFHIFGYLFFLLTILFTIISWKTDFEIDYPSCVHDIIEESESYFEKVEEKNYSYTDTQSPEEITSSLTKYWSNRRGNRRSLYGLHGSCMCLEVVGLVYFICRFVGEKIFYLDCPSHLFYTTGFLACSSVVGKLRNIVSLVGIFFYLIL